MAFEKGDIVHRGEYASSERYALILDTPTKDNDERYQVLDLILVPSDDKDSFVPEGISCLDHLGTCLEHIGQSIKKAVIDQKYSKKVDHVDVINGLETLVRENFPQFLEKNPILIAYVRIYPL